jgi:hypothetical protein
MAEETTGVRITQHMIYQKQLEMNDTQLKMLAPQHQALLVPTQFIYQITLALLLSL